MWRHIAQSLQGPSHVADGTGCQDANRVCILGDGHASTLVACVADGAGSAKFSAVGSRIACDSIVENAASYFSAFGTFANFERDDALHWCQDVHSRILAAATEQECTTRDMATTLCVAILAPNSSAFFQIGDGGIILRHHGVYGVVFWPQSGEYANSTNFLTSEDYSDQVEFLALEARCTHVALLTDGMERLALSFNQQTAHTPFFEPLFKALGNSNDLAGLNDGLRSFLGSESVQQRSDDDKTLIVASRVLADDAA